MDRFVGIACVSARLMCTPTYLGMYGYLGCTTRRSYERGGWKGKVYGVYKVGFLNYGIVTMPGNAPAPRT